MAFRNALFVSLPSFVLIQILQLFTSTPLTIHFPSALHCPLMEGIFNGFSPKLQCFWWILGLFFIHCLHPKAFFPKVGLCCVFVTPKFGSLVLVTPSLVLLDVSNSIGCFQPQIMLCWVFPTPNWALLDVLTLNCALLGVSNPVGCFQPQIWFYSVF